MNEKNIVMETDVSIPIDRLIYTILRAWRRILKTGCWVALLSAVFISAVSVISLGSEEHRTKVEREYQMELFSHNLEGKNLEMDIQNLYESIQQQETYNANSLLMQIDPYNKYVATMSYYVDTNYQIMPEYQYQNIDYGPRLVQMYTEYLTGGEMYTEIAEGLSVSHDIRFIEELFEISSYHSMGMLEIQVCAVSQEMCQEIMDIISQGMKTKHAEANQLIGDHSLAELNKNISVVVDLALDETQKQNIQTITASTIILEEKQEALEEWEREKVPEVPYSLRSVIKTLIKATIIGAVLGAVLVMAVEIACYVSGDRIVGTPEFQARCALNVLGELPEEKKKKCWMDRWVDRIGKVTLRSSNEKQLAAVTAENIFMVANCDTKMIALIGTIPSEDLENITAKLQIHVGDRIKFLAAGNPLICAASAEIVNRADAVVLVEEHDVSTYTDVINECQRMNLWGTEVLGIIFTKVVSVV